jgi:hypothetical protein
MQQQHDHHDLQDNMEKEAQALVVDLQTTVTDLEAKLALRDDLLRTSNWKQPESATAPVDALVLAVFENDELRRQLHVVCEEKAAMQSMNNEVEKENLSLSMKIQLIEEALHEATTRVKVLQEQQETSGKELTFLRKAVDDNHGLPADDKAELLQHLRQLTQYNKKPVAAEAKNTELISTLRQYHKKVEDIAQNEDDKANKKKEFWRLAYWDEAVPKAEAYAERDQRAQQGAGPRRCPRKRRTQGAQHRCVGP